jgi:hypothetical protein
MTRFLDWAAWGIHSLGIALLVVAVLLVPHGTFFAQGPDPDTTWTWLWCQLFCGCSSIPKDCTCRGGLVDWCPRTCSCPDWGIFGCGFCSP